MRIGIIGGGIAGLAAAWLLQGHHDVTLFEKQDKLGGHADTVEVEYDGTLIPVEAGFEFFSDPMFPRFNRLLALLGISIEKYMASATLYSTDQRRTTLLPPYSRDRILWSAYSPRALADLLRFQNVLTRSIPLIENADPFITLEQYLNTLKLPDQFRDDFLYPFLLAEWCVELDDFKTFSAYNVLKYVVMNRPTGFPAIINVNEIAGGMRAYIQALVTQLSRTKIRLNADIDCIQRNNAEYTVQDANSGTYQFDHLIVATGPQVASTLLKSLNFTEKIRTELDRFESFKTIIAVHGDPRLMPANPDHWSVVNTRYDGKHSSNTFWKQKKSKRPIFRSWVTFDSEMPSSLYALRTYDHQKVNLNYYTGQKNLIPLQGQDNLWLAGLYMHDIDCHESALMSAVNIAECIDPRSENLQKLMTDATLNPNIPSSQGGKNDRVSRSRNSG